MSANAALREVLLASLISREMLSAALVTLAATTGLPDARRVVLQLVADGYLQDMP